jgi:hypothetical protein
MDLKLPQKILQQLALIVKAEKREGRFQNFLGRLHSFQSQGGKRGPPVCPKSWADTWRSNDDMSEDGLQLTVFALENDKVPDPLVRIAGVGERYHRRLGVATRIGQINIPDTIHKRTWF